MSDVPHGAVRVRGLAASFEQEIGAGPHVLIADEPVGAGGGDAGPDPYELLLAALGSCTSMTLGVYARRKGIALAVVTVELSHDRIHADDCTSCETKTGKIDRITRVIRLEGDLTDEQRARLLEIADRCPVHRTLVSEIHITTRLAEP